MCRSAPAPPARRRPPRLLLAALSLLPLPGCAALAPWLAAEAASVMVFDRAIGDVVVSAVTGRDCSVVRLDMGQPYCRPEEPAPARPPLCTRSLGAVDCWRVAPPHAWPPYRGVADGPGPEDGAERGRRWPALF